ncbi:MAG: DUF2975 domain-containing protein, partial [bacterium]|nr:DUF2975 domain-containing protein [bacterium]
MSDLTRIQKASTRFRKFFIGIMIILPLIPVIVWIFFNDLPGFLRQIILSELKVPFVYNMELTTRLLACTASLIPTAVTLTGFYYLIKLFKLYEKGQIFLTENVACYRKLGYVLIVSMVTGIVHSSLMSMILSMQNPPGQRI